MDLSNKKCKPCEGGIPPLNEKEIAEYRKNISDDWKVIENKKILKEYLFGNYRQSIDFVNKVANLAEEEGHHPVMHVFYERVLIELWTHAIDGLSENDFIMAFKIDAL
ncbi:MAG: 4a-hydroxytetrahydrobiopterin dehydratase [Bacteroidales bacterium]